jgi:hypothetical protein
MESFIEKGPERIPNKEEVMEVIGRHAEGASIVRELSDEQGLYLLEAKVESKEPGETIQYEYMRKGEFADGNKSASSVIHIVYYMDGIPAGGHSVAEYNPVAGEWEEVK